MAHFTKPRITRYRGSILLTMDNGTSFIKLKALAPIRPAPIDAFLVEGEATTVADWLQQYPDFKILSYRRLPSREVH